MYDQPIISDDELYKKVNLGQAAEKFLRHDPQGRLLARRSLQEYMEAVYAFESLTVEEIMAKPAKVAGIHAKMQLARSFMIWMNENILDAQSAENELKARDLSETTID